MRTSDQYDDLQSQYPDIYNALDVFTTLIMEQDLGINGNTGERTQDPTQDIWDVLFHNAVQILQNDPIMVELPDDSKPFGAKAEVFYATIRSRKGSLNQGTLHDIFDSFDLEDVRMIQIQQNGGGKKKRGKKRKTRKMHRRRLLQVKHHRLSKKKA
jgi:hypothetical protein